jgi:hypothetical protein
MRRRVQQGLTFTIIYRDSKISSSLSVPKIAEIWDMGLKHGGQFEGLGAQYLRKLYHGCQGST